MNVYTQNIHPAIIAFKQRTLYQRNTNELSSLEINKATCFSESAICLFLKDAVGK